MFPSVAAEITDFIWTLHQANTFEIYDNPPAPIFIKKTIYLSMSP